jgi:poly-gamma-glutamate capsule biosynthesis protein CapA/YwtB (metallophosphatase superfamily)
MKNLEQGNKFKSKEEKMVALKFKIMLLLLTFLLIPSFALAEEGEITLLFGGDVTFGGAYPAIAPDPYHDFNWPFVRLRNLISQADVFMVNCENAITTYDKKVPKKFNFKMDPKLTEIFRLNKIQVTLANNHVYDYGSVGLLDTIRYLDQYGVDHVGAGKNLEAARKPIVKTIKGRKIFFLAYSNYAPTAGKAPGVARIDPDIILADIAKAKKDGAELVVINFHWGIERNHLPEESDRVLAHRLIDNGVDIIIGHHPHVTQPVEVYKGKIITYSLGNFIFGGNSRWPKESFLLRVLVNGNKLSYEKIEIRIDPQETKYQPYIISNFAKRSR